MPRRRPTERTKDRQRARLWLLRELRETRLAGDPDRTPLDLVRDLEPAWSAATHSERDSLAAGAADRLGLGRWVAEIVATTLAAWSEMPPCAGNRSALMTPAEPVALFAMACDFAPSDPGQREKWAIDQYTATKRLLIDDESGTPLHFEPPLPLGMREARPPFVYEFGRRTAAAGAAPPRSLPGPWASRRDVAALARFVTGGKSLAALAKRFGLARPVAMRAVRRAAEVTGVDLGPVLARPEHKAGRPRKPVCLDPYR